MKNIIKKLLGIKEIKGVDLQPLKTRTVFPEHIYKLKEKFKQVSIFDVEGV